MSRLRFQFTLGQLVSLVGLSAFLLLWLRTPIGTTVLALTGVVILGSFLDRVRGGDGIIGGTVAGGLVSCSYELVDLAIRWLFHDPRDENIGFLLFVPLSLAAGVVWGTLVSAALDFIIARPSHADQMDQSEPRAS